MAQDDKPTLVQRPAGYDKLVPKGYKNVAKDKVYKKLEDITKTDVATFIAEMTPVIGDAMAAKEVYDEIQKDDPNWLLIGALGGATIVGAVPFVGDAASKLIKKGARQALDVAKRIEVDPNAIGSLGGNIRIKAAQEVVEDFVPQKTVKAYKLFTKGKDGKLYPLFVDAQKEVPTDKWLAATFPDYRFTADNGKQYVPSKGTDGKPGTGDSINIPDQETRDKLIEAGFLPKGSKAKAVKAVAARPGWHAGDVPIATHIGPETNIGGKQVKYRGDDQVWAEIEMPADVDWQQIANSKARIKKDGNIDVRTADINDEMPKAGHYRYKTNPNMTGEWLISGDMKVNRVLDRSEVNAINEAAGVKDLPTLSELNKGYSKGGTVMDDYQYAEMMSNGYAVGGAVEKQTRMAFADGGLPVDPVSGNEVPPGSLPEEVRDDIKVGVSAGEYIVPADVLRYYGMKFFEDLRAEAKAALSGMEQDGRMGGEPMMEAPMEAEDDLPFDTSELITEDAMNEGGYMRGYAAAGLVVDPAVGNPEGSTDVNLDFLSQYNVGSGGSGTTTKTYYGPNGEEVIIDFYNGNPLQVPPVGYTTTKPVVKASDVAPTDDNEPEIYKPKKESLDWANMNADELLNQAGKLTTPLARTASGVAQAIIPGSTLMIEAQRKQVANALRNAYNDPNLLEADKLSIEKQFAANQGFLGKLLGLTGPLIADKSKYIAPTPAAAPNQLAAQAEASAKANLNPYQFGEYQRLQDQGYTGSGINGYAVGNISDGTTAGVVAKPDGTVEKNDEGQTIYRDSKGNTYVTNWRGVLTTPTGGAYSGPADAKFIPGKVTGNGLFSDLAQAINRTLNLGGGGPKPPVATVDNPQPTHGGGHGNNNAIMIAGNNASEAAAQSAQSSNAQQGNLSSGQSNAGSNTVSADRLATESAQYGALNKGGLMTKKKKK